MFKCIKKYVSYYIQLHQELANIGIFMVPGYYNFEYYFNPEKYDRLNSFSKNFR